MPAGADDQDLPDLDAGTDADGNPITATHPLRYRPAHYVPFKVPLYDEQYTHIQQDLYEQAQQDNPDNNIKEPEPLYRWYYRPELQFSQYDFDAKSLIVKQTDENDNETTSSIDISEDGADFGAIFDEYTDSVELLFDLLGPELEPLPSLEAEREFVLSLGGEEVLATIGQDGKVVFENPEHLNRLSEEDLLSLRLYLNGDSANVLWEYAFDGLQILPPEGAIVELNADQAFELPAAITGYVTTATGDEEEAYRIRWNSLLGPQPSPNLQTSFAGIFSTTAAIGTNIGSETQVEGTLFGQEVTQKSAIFKVTEAGQAHSINANITGSASVANNGQYTIEATIKDRFGNLVSDGTAVSILAPGFDIDSNNQTLNGKVIAHLSGLDHAGSFEVTLASGNAIFTQTLSISNLTVQINAPATIAINESALITFTTPAEDGTPIYIGNKRGRFKERLLHVQNGQASAELEAGEFRGKGFITARIGSTVTKHDFNVIETGGITLLDTLLVTNVLAAGSDIIEGKTVEYTPSTALRLTGGIPGEQALVSLLDYLDPSLPEILDYSFVKQPASTQIADRVQGKIAVLANVGWQDSGIYLADSQSSFNIQSLTTPTDQAGITFALKPESNGQLIELPSIGLQVSITNNRLLVSLAGSEIESAPLEFNQWQRVGIHWYSSELVVQIDDAIIKTPISTVANLSGDALIGSGFTGGINDIRFYNWLAPAQLTLADGTQEGSGIYDQQGIANIGITTNPAAIAYQQQLRRSEMIAQMERGFSIMSSTYATDPVTSLASQCQVPDVNAENYLNAGAAMIEYIGSCMLKNNLKKAKIKVQNSEGLVERSIALMELANLKVVYGALYAIKTAGHFGVDCGIGAVTGNVDTGARMTCDLITSFYLIGDVRDLIIHGYYWGTVNNEFDKATVVFASIGLAGSASIVLAGAGVPVAALAAGGKVVAKLLNRAPVITHIADDIWHSYATHGKTMAEALERTSPLLMITAFVVLEGESLVQVKDFVVEAIDDKEDFDAWVDYTQAYFQKAAQSANLTAHNIPRELLNLLIAQAYAGVVDELGTRTVREFVQILSKVNETGNDIRKSSSEIAQAFTQALDVLKAIPEQTQHLQLKELALGERINAFAMVYAIGQEKALNALRVIPCNPQNCPFGSLDDFLGSIEELASLRKAEKVSEEALESFQKVMSDLGHINQGGSNPGQVNFFLARGAAGVVSSVKKLTDQGYVIKGFEVKVANSTQNGNARGNRFMDITAIDPDGRLVQIEVKSYEELENAKYRVLQSLRANSQPIDKGMPGQFRKDLVAMAKTSGRLEDDNRLWVFAYDAVESRKSEIADVVIDEIRSNTALRNKLILDVTGRVAPRDKRQVNDIVDEFIFPAVDNLFKGI